MARDPAVRMVGFRVGDALMRAEAQGSRHYTMLAFRAQNNLSRAKTPVVAG